MKSCTNARVAKAVKWNIGLCLLDNQALFQQFLGDFIKALNVLGFRTYVRVFNRKPSGTV